jgi:hypothetical protein
MNYVVYSHTEFSDILQVQTDYLKDIKEKYLFLNKGEIDPAIIAEYKDVIFYDDSKPYANRLVECLEQLQDKHDINYCLFLHDNDIILHKDDEVLDNCLQLMKQKAIHRICLQFDWGLNDKEKIINVHSFLEEEEPKKDNYYIRLDAVGDFPYNVNPSLWNVSNFIRLLEVDKNLGYRQIEMDQRIQNHTRNFVRTHRMFGHVENLAQSGYFCCLPPFIFLHITHSGKLVPTNKDEEFFYKHKNPLYDVRGEYGKILEKYKLSEKRRHG